MSLILDALSRAERDRRRGQGEAPDLLAEHGTAAPSSSPLRLPLMVGLALAVVAFSAWLLVGVFSRSADPGPVPAAALSPSSAASASSVLKDTGAPATLERGQSSGADVPHERVTEAVAVARPLVAPAAPSVDSAAIAELYAAAESAPAQSATPTAEATPKAREAREAQRPATDPAAPAATAPRENETGVVGEGEGEADGDQRLREETPVDLERVLRLARAEAAASKLSAHPAPLLQTLSKQFRDRVPTLMYLRHDFNPMGTSTVVINGETLIAGNRSRGVELREILADSVILSFEGRDFRLRALNSWVNL